MARAWGSSRSARCPLWCAGHRLDEHSLRFLNPVGSGPGRGESPLSRRRPWTAPATAAAGPQGARRGVCVGGRGLRPSPFRGAHLRKGLARHLQGLSGCTSGAACGRALYSCRLLLMLRIDKCRLCEFSTKKYVLFSTYFMSSFQMTSPARAVSWASGAGLPISVFLNGFG